MSIPANIVFADRVRETSVSTGTGDFLPTGAVPGYRAFAGAVPVDTPFYYSITGVTLPGEWETGVGALTAGGLVTRAPQSSSNGGALVNFGAGTKLISLTVAADWFEEQSDPTVDGLEVTRGALVNGAELRNAVTVGLPTGSQVGTSGTDDAVNAVLRISTGRFSQGPTGATNYSDNVVDLGMNLPLAGGVGSTPPNPQMPTVRIAMESKFAQGGPTSDFIAEYHMASLFPVGDYSNEFRAISATIPHDRTRWAASAESGVSMRGNTFAWYRGDGLVVPIAMNFVGPDNPVVDYSGTPANGVKLRFGRNNASIVQQRNAAGSQFLDHFFYNAQDALETQGTATLIMNGAAKTVALTGNNKALLALNGAGMTANGFGAFLASPTAVTGSITGYLFEGNASVKVENTTINNAASGKAGQRLRTSGGSMYSEFNDLTNGRSIGFTYYPGSGGSLALDNASQGGQFANKNAFTIDFATFQCRFGVAPRLPSFTVAALPGAATAGAGAMAYATNARNAGEGVGAGTGSIVASDGTSWKIPGIAGAVTA